MLGMTTCLSGMRDRFDIFGTVTRIRKQSTFGNDVKNTQQPIPSPLLPILSPTHPSLPSLTTPSSPFPDDTPLPRGRLTRDVLTLPSGAWADHGTGQPTLPGVGVGRPWP